jgi:hypothetical protein
VKYFKHDCLFHQREPFRHLLTLNDGRQLCYDLIIIMEYIGRSLSPENDYATHAMLSLREWSNVLNYKSTKKTLGTLTKLGNQDAVTVEKRKVKTVTKYLVDIPMMVEIVDEYCTKCIRKESEKQGNPKAKIPKSLKDKGDSQKKSGQCPDNLQSKNVKEEIEISNVNVPETRPAEGPCPPHEDPPSRGGELASNGTQRKHEPEHASDLVDDAVRHLSTTHDSNGTERYPQGGVPSVVSGGQGPSAGRVGRWSTQAYRDKVVDEIVDLFEDEGSRACWKRVVPYFCQQERGSQKLEDTIMNVLTEQKNGAEFRDSRKILMARLKGEAKKLGLGPWPVGKNAARSARV